MQVPSLQNLCIRVISANFPGYKSFSGVPADLQQKIGALSVTLFNPERHPSILKSLPLISTWEIDSNNPFYLHSVLQSLSSLTRLKVECSHTLPVSQPVIPFTSLQMLTFRNVQLSSLHFSHMKNLWKLTLHECPRLTCLIQNLNTLHLSHLNLDDNTLTKAGGVDLANYLKKATELKFLSLRGCDLFRVNMMQVVASLPELKVLHLDNAKINPSMYKFICSKLLSHNFLQVLGLSRLNMGRLVVAEITEQLIQNTTLLYLNLNSNGFTIRAIVEIIQSLKQNSTLQTLDLSVAVNGGYVDNTPLIQALTIKLRLKRLYLKQVGNTSETGRNLLAEVDKVNPGMVIFDQNPDDPLRSRSKSLS